MFDNLTSDIHCPRCAYLSRSVEETRVQTYLRRERDGSLLEPGYEFSTMEIQPESIADAGYAPLRPITVDGMVRILDVWTCPSCKVEQWGAIEIDDGRFSKITPVAMSKKALRDAHFISEVDAISLAGSLLGLSPRAFDEQQLDPVEVLRQHLPA